MGLSLNLSCIYVFKLKSALNGAAAEVTGRVIATGNDCKTIEHNGANSKSVSVGEREFFLTDQGQCYEVVSCVEAAYR